jgi:hypothetical protein
MRSINSKTAFQSFIAKSISRFLLTIPVRSHYALEVYRNISVSVSRGLKYGKIYISDTYHTTYLSIPFQIRQ